MPDISLRKNQKCIIGMPSCGYAFSSSRNVFIAYGFETSTFEKDILLGLLQASNLVPIEAAGLTNPGQNAFCTKICSQVIISRFCIVLLNDDKVGEITKPNANVYMEYGMMLGFNKLILPFQREGQNLSFNVSGLDTIKYTQNTFRDRAVSVIRKAIADTEPELDIVSTDDERIGRYLLKAGYITFMSSNPGDTIFPTLANHFGFSLYTNIGGDTLIFVGSFGNRRASDIALSVDALSKVLMTRTTDEALNLQISIGMTDANRARFAQNMLRKSEILLIFNDITLEKEMYSCLQGFKIDLKVSVVVLQATNG
jgi:hypothetical protein